MVTIGIKVTGLLTGFLKCVFDSQQKFLMNAALKLYSIHTLFFLLHLLISFLLFFEYAYLNTSWPLSPVNKSCSHLECTQIYFTLCFKSF